MLFKEARYYDPDIGRWLTPDPAGMVDGPNRYLYLLGDPVNAVDSYGLFRFAKNPLNSIPWLGPLSSNPMLDRGNLEISHEQGFFEDGSGYNRGWSPNGTFTEEDWQQKGYHFDDVVYDDRTMREALRILEGEYRGQEYRLIGNNCQDFTQRWREIYWMLKLHDNIAQGKERKN